MRQLLYQSICYQFGCSNKVAILPKQLFYPSNYSTKAINNKTIAQDRLLFYLYYCKLMTAGWPPVGPLVKHCSQLDSPNLIIATRLILLMVAATLICAFCYIGICCYKCGLQVGDSFAGIDQLICFIRFFAGYNSLTKC